MDIVEKSNAILRRIEQNDPKLTSLAIVDRGHTRDYLKGCFWCYDGVDMSRLGNAIANNTQLREITFHNSSEWTHTRSFFEGLQRNTAITRLQLNGYVANAVLDNYVANNSSLKQISIMSYDLRDGVAGNFAKAMKKCPSLNTVSIVGKPKVDDASMRDFALGIIRGLSSLEKLFICLNVSTGIDGIQGAEAIGNLLQDPNCNLNTLMICWHDITNESVSIIVNGLIGNTKLKHLNLAGLGMPGRSMERSSCDSIVNLLQTPSCSLTDLSLNFCGINNELVTVIISSLRGNTKMKHLDLSGNSIGRSGCESIATLLQDTNSNISGINLSGCKIGNDCAALLAQALVGNNKLKRLDLALNSGITESGWNAFSTILSSCSNTTLSSLGADAENMPANLKSLLKLNLAVDNMEPLFKLDAGDDEKSPKALPSVIAWFGRRARESTQNEEVLNSINARKLSAIFQFARNHLPFVV